MKTYKRLITVFISIFLVTFCSCKYDLVEAPTHEGAIVKNPADYPDSILPPATLSATQGGYRTINLSWQKVENAVQYYIYSASSPFDEFTQIAETISSETSINIEEASGITKFYKVSAINYYGTISTKSTIVQGSTLAVPFITDIESEDEGTALKVSWWMDNASVETYENNLQYKITVYNSEKQEIEGIEFFNLDIENNKIIYNDAILPGTERSVTAANLTAKTDYYFIIEAQLFSKDAEGNLTVLHSEKCDYTNASTAHSVIPLEPTEVKAEQGKSTEYIEISWALPKAVDYYDSKAKSYVPHPVYFEVQRRLYSAPEETVTEEPTEETKKEKVIDDTGFETIKRIGVTGLETTIRGETKRNSPATIELMYNCTEGKTYYPDGTDAAEILSVTSAGTETAIENYEQYIPGYRLSFKDDSATALRGEQYEYRVVSFADDITQKRSNDNSKSEMVVGWKVPFANFITSKSYNLAEGSETHIASFNVNFVSNFKDFGLSNYKYLIEEKVTSTGSSEEIINPIIVISSAAELNTYSRIVDTSSNPLGKYEYTLYICYDSEDITSALITQKAIGSVMIVDDTSNLPTLEYLEVEDGYKDKFRVYWNLDASLDYTYTITKYVYENENTRTISDEILYENVEYERRDNAAFFDIEATSGEVAMFKIDAYKNSIFSGDISTEVYSYTLGTPVPSIQKLDYRTINIIWPKVQKSTDYSVSAYYESDLTNNLVNSENHTISESNGNYSCIITDPEGFDDANRGGLPVKVTIQAINSERSDTTSADITSRTLGPAAIKYDYSSNPEKDSISFSWEKVDGVSNYLIYRAVYKDCSVKEIDTSNIFIYENNTLSEYQPTTDIKNYTSISLENDSSGNLLKYTFTDIQHDAESGEEGSYFQTQEKIQWGLPFGYVVLPLADECSKDDFVFTDEGITLSSESKVVYSNLKDINLNTEGYGLNVRASKCESAQSIHITWEKPNNTTGLQPTIYRIAFDKSQNHDYGKVWNKIETLPEGRTEYDDNLSKNITDEGKFYKAFLYAVEYEAGTNSNFASSYRKAINKADSNQKEGNNKGYLFTIPGFSTDRNDTETINEKVINTEKYYQEGIYWNAWDLSERAKYPEKFTVDLKNKNLSSTANWTSLVTVKLVPDGNSNIKYEISKSSKIKDSDDVTLTIDTNNNKGFKIQPTSLGTGTTELQKVTSEGLLKVLRDTKHYYSLNITGSGNTNRQAEDESIYAYRQISDAELAKCVSLIIADALYQCSIPTETGAGAAGSSEECDGASGKFKIVHTGWSDSCEWGFNGTNYQHIFRSGIPTDKTSPLTSTFIITGNTAKAGSYSLSKSSSAIRENKLYYLPSLEIKVTSECNLSSHKIDKLYFTAGALGTNTKYNLEISKESSKIISVNNNKDELVSNFPYLLGEEYKNKITTFDSSLPLYQSPWWN